MKKNPGWEERRGSAFGPEIMTRMGQQLRVTYGEVMNEGVPDRLSELLVRLDALDSERPGKAAPRASTGQEQSPR